jgi:ParB-like chromosome segregation protein Spo0J
VPTSELRVETVALATLFPSPSNPRHNDDAVEHVAASIRRFGFQQPLVAKRSGEVIAGNTRWKAAKALGLAEVPVVWFDGSELDATAFAIADNRTHEFAEWDEPALARLLQQLREEDALDGVGYDDAEIDRLIAELDTAVDDVGDDEAVEPPETPTTRRGDLWILGGHRLLCGDSTSADDVARLMAGEKASLLATDPPYLVDYQGGNHPQSSVNRPDVKDKHWDDYVDPQTSVEFFASFLRIALQHCVERVPVYQWHATRRQALVEEAWKANGLLVHQTIIWAKARTTCGRTSPRSTGGVRARSPRRTVGRTRASAQSGKSIRRMKRRGCTPR